MLPEAHLEDAVATVVLMMNSNAHDGKTIVKEIYVQTELSILSFVDYLNIIYQNKAYR